MGIKEDIDRGLAIVAEIAALNDELKFIKTRVEKAALNGPQIPLEDADRDGMQYIARGSEKLVPVVITADYLAASFVSGSKMHEKIVAALPNREPLLTDFYLPKLTFERVYDDGKAFRRQAREILGDEVAAPFLAACVVRDTHGVPKNAVKIAWDRARALEVRP